MRVSRAATLSSLCASALALLAQLLTRSPWLVLKRGVDSCRTVSRPEGGAGGGGGGGGGGGVRCVRVCKHVGIG